MKTAFKILFTLGLIAAAATGNPVLAAVSGTGLVMAHVSPAAYFNVKLALFTLVPAVLRDPTNGDELPPFTRAQKFLFDFLRNKSNVVTFDAFKSEAIFFDPINYYIRYVIPKLQQGRYQILGPNTTQVVGASNFYSQATLPQYYNFCFDRMQVNYGTTNTDAAVAQALAGWTNVRSSMPTALGNGEIIVQLNKNIIVQTGIVDFTSEAAIVGGNSLDFAGGALQVPRVLQENQQIACDLDLAVAQAFPNAANTTYGVEVLFKGIQLRLR